MCKFEKNVTLRKRKKHENVMICMLTCIQFCCQFHSAVFNAFLFEFYCDCSMSVAMSFLIVFCHAGLSFDKLKESGSFLSLLSHTKFVLASFYR